MVEGKNRRRYTIWSPEKIDNAFDEDAARLRRIPSSDEFSKNHGGALGAISDYHGGFVEFRKKLGESIIKLPNGSLKDWNSFKGILEEIINCIGHFPTSGELEKLREGSVANAIYTHHGGMSEVRRRMGYEAQQKEPLELLLEGYVGMREGR